MTRAHDISFTKISLSFQKLQSFLYSDQEQYLIYEMYFLLSEYINQLLVFITDLK